MSNCYCQVIYNLLYWCVWGWKFSLTSLFCVIFIWADSLAEIDQTQFCDITDVFWLFWVKLNHREHGWLPWENFSLMKFKMAAILFSRNILLVLFWSYFGFNVKMYVLKVKESIEIYFMVLRHETIFYLTFTQFLFSKFVELLMLSKREENLCLRF